MKTIGRNNVRAHRKYLCIIFPFVQIAAKLIVKLKVIIANDHELAITRIADA
jgi:hypothetical protein